MLSSLSLSKAATRAETNSQQRMPREPRVPHSHHYGHDAGSDSIGKYRDEEGLEAAAMRAAGNSTLGFSSIKCINLPHRYDRADAATLQAYLAGIDLEAYPAVRPDQIVDVRMPPSSNPRALKRGEKGCWRAHANIWAEMLRNRLPPDVNVRPVMALLSKQLTRLLRESGSRPLYQDRRRDILSLGACFDEPYKTASTARPQPHVRYADPFAPSGDAIFRAMDTTGQRTVHRGGGWVCTTAYAITQRGAAKLLLRTAMNLNAPVDMIVRDVVQRGEAVAYGAVPTVFAQRRRDGAESIENGSDDDDDDEENLTGWDEAMRTKSVWGLKAEHVHAAFKIMALEAAVRGSFSFI
ncbi:hypothetical protein B0T24DRAFT_686377 [Lasiosphaeria ovina]|uniref:Glycosyl transferase family 25 domain-containing protein n=1 Tax=Lasiosphaeria ovina TaxID=92902 RepID=A0AAE0TWW1_9PEZI|nr:hypothetical protein B0T24DRAFT_686377 [Lasiosphaeria ovina]